MLEINRFVSQIGQTGFASPNKYLVEFNSPLTGNDDTISIMCNVAGMPERGIQVFENRHYNTPFKLPYVTMYQEATFTFFSTPKYPERKFFDAWQNEVIHPENGLVGFYDTFRGDIVVSHLEGETGSVDYKIKLMDAYPTSIGSIELGYSMTDSLSPVSISFVYKYWIEDK